MIAVSCGIKISTMHCLCLSRRTRVADRRTDKRTDKITTPKDRVSIAASRGKNGRKKFSVKVKIND